METFRVYPCRNILKRVFIYGLFIKSIIHSRVKILFRVNRQWLYNFADVVCALRAACRGARRRRPYIWARRTDRRLLVFATQKIPKRNLREKHDGPFSSVSVTAKNSRGGIPITSAVLKESR
jgi:hypothetical protein